MDGMFYRREQDEFVGTPDPAPDVGRLILLTVIVAVIVVGTMMVLLAIGQAPVLPLEFPLIAPPV